MNRISRSCSVFWESAPSAAAFVPEDFSQEQRMFAELSEKFAESEIAPVSGDIEAMAPGLMPSLLRKAGELGLLIGKGVSTHQLWCGRRRDH